MKIYTVVILIKLRLIGRYELNQCDLIM